MRVRLFDKQVFEQEPLARYDAFAARIETEIGDDAQAVIRQGVACDDGGRANEDLAVTGVDIEAKKQLAVNDTALRKESDAATTNHDAAARLVVAASREAIGKGSK